MQSACGPEKPQVQSHAVITKDQADSDSFTTSVLSRSKADKPCLTYVSCVANITTVLPISPPFLYRNSGGGRSQFKIIFFSTAKCKHDLPVLLLLSTSTKVSLHFNS